MGCPTGAESWRWCGHLSREEGEAWRLRVMSRSKAVVAGGGHGGCAKSTSIDVAARRGDKHVMHRFTLEYWQDEGWYVGRLKEVAGVASQGQTLAELEETFATPTSS